MVIVVLVLGATAYAVRFQLTATALIDSAQEINTTEDAVHQISVWNNHKGIDSWTDSYDEGHSTHYYVRLSNGISGLHFAPWSALVMHVTMHDAKVICVTVETNSPTASVVLQEWFKPDMRDEFYLSYLKAAIPTARLQFPSSLPAAQKRKAFAIRTRCLLIPRLCATTEDLLPLIRSLELRTPD
jgi:hypothetical protein